MHTIKFNYKNLYISLLVLLALAGAFLFSSCENFLDDKNVSDEILDTIAYNNAPDCNVLFQADNEMGKFLTGENIIFKVGYNSEVQFSVNKNDYIFTGLEAVSKTNPDKSLADYVSISNKGADEEKGIYTFDVKVTKKTSDLMIRPVCIAYPAVISYSPSSNEPQFVSVPIVITFNLPMVNEGTNEAIEINSSNISIKAGGVLISEYFAEPFFNEDKTKLTLQPKPKELNEYITKLQADFIEVQIQLTDNIIIKNNERTLALKQNDNSNFIIKYKGGMDETPPQRIDFFVTRHPITIETAGTIQDSDKFLLEAFETKRNINFDKADKNKNNGTIYIYGKYYDENPGVESVTIGDVVYNSQNAEFINDGKGNTIFCIKHILTKPEDNTLECYVSDYIMNASNHITFTAYYKTLDASKILVYNFDHDFFENSQTTEFNLAYYNENRKIIKIPYTWDDNDYMVETNPFVYNDVYFKKFSSLINEIDYYSNFKLKYEYKDKDGTLKTGEFSNDKNNKLFYHELQNVDKLNGLKIKITVIDDLQNQDESLVVFPVESVIKDIKKSSDNTTQLYFEPICIGQAKDQNEDGCFIYPDQVLLYENNGVLKQKNFPDGSVISSNTEYKVIPMHIEIVGDYVMLYGDIGSQIYTTESTLDFIPDVVLDGEPTFKQGLSEWTGGQGAGEQYWTHYMDITFKISPDSWNNFDSIYILHHGYNALDDKYSFKENEYELTFSIATWEMHRYDTNFTVFGIKGTKRSQGLNYQIAKFTGTPDYNPPAITITKYINPQKFKIKITDDGSGPDYAYVENISNNGVYKYILNQSNSYEVEIPYWELLETKKYRYSTQSVSQTVFIKAIGYDLNGNRGVKSFEFRVQSNDYYSYPTTPDTNHNKQYDLLIPNGGATTKSLAISSNAKVMVHTLVTTTPYSECKDWSIYEWEHYKKTLNQQELTFSSSNHNLQRYDIPYNEIYKGESYCVIAWFADGHAEQSEVWQK